MNIVVINFNVLYPRLNVYPHFNDLKPTPATAKPYRVRLTPKPPEGPERSEKKILDYFIIFENKKKTNNGYNSYVNFSPKIIKICAGIFYK